MKLQGEEFEPCKIRNPITCRVKKPEVGTTVVTGMAACCDMERHLESTLVLERVVLGLLYPKDNCEPWWEVSCCPHVLPSKLSETPEAGRKKKKKNPPPRRHHDFSDIN